MKPRAAISFSCFVLARIILGAFGLIYLLSPKFMPYHAAAIGVGWEELAPQYQTLFLGLLKAAGGGFLATAVAVLMSLLVPHRPKALSERWSLLIIGLTAQIPALYGTIIVKWGTPASPPWYASAAAIVLIIVGLALSTSDSTEIGEESRRAPSKQRE